MSVLKLYISMGSQKEYILVHGQKPILISDLKNEINRSFRIPLDQQFILFKGNNLHEYSDETPLETFGLENNSAISVWTKGIYSESDLRLPKEIVPPILYEKKAFATKTSLQLNSNRQNGQDEIDNEIFKLEIQHGSDRHQLILKGYKTKTVYDLQNELEKLTAVPISNQRIYFKAQELHSASQKLLKDFDIKNNNVIRLVGEPSKMLYSNYYFGKLNTQYPLTKLEKL